MIRDILSGVPMIRRSHVFTDVSRQEDAVGSFSGQRHRVSWEPMDQGLLTCSMVSMVRNMPHGSS